MNSNLTILESTLFDYAYISSYYVSYGGAGGRVDVYSVFVVFVDCYKLMLVKTKWLSKFIKWF